MALTAWMDQRRAYDGFAVVPAAPVQFTPTAILPLSTTLDAGREAELVRMANLVPRKGRPAEPFGPAAPLWEQMAAVLDRMDFARRALTDSEAAELDAARQVLYVTDKDGIHTSAQYNAYLEMSAVVQSLQDAGASVEVQQAALSDWLVLGYKNEVEQALVDLTRLASRSSVVEAASCRAQLHETALLSAGDISYAPTSFYPLSAANCATWTIAEATFAELADCAAKAFPGTPVMAPSASAAKCRFAYAMIETLRPWPFAQLLKRDDWRLPDGELVSGGDGINGSIPAYVQTIYAASVIGLASTPPPRPRWRLGPFTPAKPPVRGIPHRVLPPPWTTVQGGGNAGGVVPGRTAQLVLPRTAALGGITMRYRDPALVQRFQIPLDRSEWLARLAIARSVGEGAPAPDPEPAESSVADLAAGARVVGFGCVTVPVSPRPNDQYQWQ
ncbi:hypothetical protein [Streptomyces sp. NPDC093568]|uniref:hypothetical protein n=1 Tax=Streptomyces sp. NPDC093568 TaxID=3366041 RepID=UPI0037F23C81